MVDGNVRAVHTRLSTHYVHNRNFRLFEEMGWAIDKCASDTVVFCVWTADGHHQRRGHRMIKTVWFLIEIYDVLAFSCDVL